MSEYATCELCPHFQCQSIFIPIFYVLNLFWIDKGNYQSSFVNQAFKLIIIFFEVAYCFNHDRKDDPILNALEKYSLRADKPVMCLSKANFIEAMDMKEFDCNSESKNLVSNKNPFQLSTTISPSWSVSLVASGCCSQTLQRLLIDYRVSHVKSWKLSSGLLII